MTILFYLLFISIVGLISIISYKYISLEKLKASSVADGSGEHFSSKVLKEKFRWLFTSANDRIVQRAIMRLKGTYKVVLKNVSDQHNAFIDAVNGKGVYDPDKKQKWATSIFLQTVSDHKKKIQEDRKDSE